MPQTVDMQNILQLATIWLILTIQKSRLLNVNKLCKQTDIYAGHDPVRKVSLILIQLGQREYSLMGETSPRVRLTGRLQSPPPPEPKRLGLAVWRHRPSYSARSAPAPGDLALFISRINKNPSAFSVSFTTTISRATGRLSSDRIVEAAMRKLLTRTWFREQKKPDILYL